MLRAIRSYPNITLENNVVTDEFVETIIREEDETENVPENVPEKSIGGRLSDVLKFIGEDANVTISELARRLDFTEKTIKRDIEKLKQLGKLERIGTDKGGHWKVK